MPPFGPNASIFIPTCENTSRRSNTPPIASLRLCTSAFGLLITIITTMSNWTPARRSRHSCTNSLIVLACRTVGSTVYLAQHTMCAFHRQHQNHILPYKTITTYCQKEIPAYPFEVYFYFQPHPDITNTDGQYLLGETQCFLLTKQFQSLLLCICGACKLFQ